MNGDWLGLIELMVVAGLVLGWAVYELRVTPKPGDRGKSEARPEAASENPPRHPKG